MTRFQRGKIFGMALAAATFGMMRGSAVAAAATPTITYTASGTFAGTPISGSDVFRLAGQPFSIGIVANDSQLSTFHGPTYAGYAALQMTGTIHSALVPTPVTISNRNTWIVMANGNPSYNIFALGTQVRIIGLTLKISANLILPKGSLTSVRNHAFPPITLTPSAATMTYSDGTSATTLGITGILYGSSASGAATAGATPVLLHAAGARVITAHADGTQSERAVRSMPVDLGASSDSVALGFYASGLGDASGISVQIAGQDVPVLYAGASGHYPGLDEVTVQVPHGLAGSGDVEVLLRVSGATANSVHIRIQ